jgi:hypothetical protein
MTKHIVIATREQWLTDAIAMITDALFKKGNYVLPDKIKVGCGFPIGNVNKVIGQCHHQASCKDGSVNIFISPTQAEPKRVLDILVHELGHAALGHEAKHGPKFKKFCQSVGLVGKPTTTTVEPGSPLDLALDKIVAQLGPYPHSEIMPRPKPKKPGGGGWLRFKAIAEGMDEYRVMISPKQLEEHGPPLDPEAGPMVFVDEEEVAKALMLGIEINRSWMVGGEEDQE